MADFLTLTELINVETLQCVQDAFSSVSGMAALTTDVSGVPVTVGIIKENMNGFWLCCWYGLAAQFFC